MPKRTFKFLHQSGIKFQEKIHRTKPQINIEVLGYVSSKYKIYYECSKHNYKGYASGAAIIKSKGCPHCQKENHLYNDPDFKEQRRKTEFSSFLIKSIALHGDKYSYTEDDYICSRTLMKIFCNRHQSYFWQRPSAHLQGQGCPDCGDENQIINTTIPKEDFIRRAMDTNQNPNISFEGCEYIKMQAPITVRCKIHGDITKDAHTFVKNPQTCNLCNLEARRKKEEQDFIDSAKNRHGNLYDYSLVAGHYKSNRSRLPVKCNTHDIVFYTSRNKHVDIGTGCPVCARQKMGRWNLKCLEKNLDYFKNKPCANYLMLVETPHNFFYKVGISVDPNFRRLGLQGEILDSKVTVLLEKWSNVYDCVALEKSMHESLKLFQYTPEVKFGGYTECFIFPEDHLVEVKELFS